MSLSEIGTPVEAALHGSCPWPARRRRPLAKRIIAVDAHECIDAAIDGVDAVELPHGLTGEFGREPGRQLVEGEFVQHHSTIFGTTNRPFAALGALAKASSLLMDGHSSARRTLSSGTAWYRLHFADVSSSSFT